MILNLRMRNLSLGLACSLLSACSNSEAPSASRPVTDDFETVQAADKFSGAYVGIAATTPPTVLAWRTLLAQPDADRSFKLLVADATLPGQLYGLAGVYFTDPPALESLAAPYLVRPDSIWTAFGCIESRDLARSIAGRILDGTLPAELQGSDSAP